MKTVAFDVKGTLDGHYRPKVLALLKAFIKHGYEIHVWSNSMLYAKQESDKLTAMGIKHTYGSKFSKSDADEYNPNFNFAVEDDERQKYLAADNFIFVSQLIDVDNEHMFDYLDRTLMYVE